MDLWALIRRCRFVDLTHACAPGQPRFPGDPDEQRVQLSTVAADGCAVIQHTLVGQWGTHVDAPNHFVAGGRSVDALLVDEMISPLVVLDFHTEVAANPEFLLQPDHILRWEKHCGKIPDGAFVAFRSDWSKRWPSQQAMENGGKCPGWSVAAIDFLVEHRNIRAIGHETFDTDPSLKAQRAILAHDRWQIELLTNLDQLPATGALLVATWPKIKDGTGFPARVFALIA